MAISQEELRGALQRRDIYGQQDRERTLQDRSRFQPTPQGPPRDYMQRLWDDSDIAEAQAGHPLTVRVGTTTGDPMARPSLAALQRLRELDPDPNTQTIEPTFEQRRLAGVMGDADARANRQLEAERQRNDTMFDINTGGLAARARAAGDIQTEESRRAAQTKNDIYFSPDERRRREDEFLTEMQRIRTRYTDPAMIAAQARIEAEKERGQSAQAVEGTRQAGGIERQDLTNQGNLGVAGVRGNAQIGAEIAKQGGDPSGYRPQTTPGAAPGKTFTMKDVADYARDHNMSAMDALTTFRTSGYTFVK